MLFSKLFRKCHVRLSKSVTNHPNHLPAKSQQQNPLSVHVTTQGFTKRKAICESSYMQMIKESHQEYNKCKLVHAWYLLRQCCIVWALYVASQTYECHKGPAALPPTTSISNVTQLACLQLHMQRKKLQSRGKHCKGQSIDGQCHWLQMSSKLLTPFQNGWTYRLH